MSLQTELTELFKNGHEEVYFRDSTEDNGITDLFKEDDKVICYIHCEYVAEENDKVNLNYDAAYFGSEKFNDILEKYNMCLEWENPCLASIYPESDIDSESGSD